MSPDAPWIFRADTVSCAFLASAMQKKDGRNEGIAGRESVTCDRCDTSAIYELTRARVYGLYRESVTSVTEPPSGRVR
jgi:hypothetical protein